MNLAELLHRSARVHGDRPALGAGTRIRCSYRYLSIRVAALAAGLREKFALQPGDRVAFAMANCPEYWELMFACWHAGLAAVPMNAKLHAKEFEYIVANSGAKAVFYAPKDFAGIAAAPGPAYPSRPDDLAWLFYTSGTTGVPKGAMLTQRNLLFAVHCYFADIDKLSSADAILHAAPLSHGSGLYGLPHFAAGAVNVIPESGGFDAAELFDLMDHWPGSSLFAAPTMLVRLLASPAARAPRQLKTISYGGAPMYVADSLRAIDLFGGEHLYQLFGQGESPMTITGLPQSFHARKENLDTVGYSRSGVEVKVLESGEVVTRSDCVMAGYWNNPAATAKAIQGGWLHTGDVGRMDQRGFVTLLDRSKDMIISGGSNIYPREIEEVLLRHPAVAECSVVGRPHPEWGEVVVAFIVSKTKVDTGELDALCLASIARYKRPREYRFVDSLPKNNYGKVLKTALRAALTRPDAVPPPIVTGSG